MRVSQAPRPQPPWRRSQGWRRTLTAMTDGWGGSGCPPRTPSRNAHPARIGRPEGGRRRRRAVGWMASRPTLAVPVQYRSEQRHRYPPLHIGGRGRCVVLSVPVRYEEHKSVSKKNTLPMAEMRRHTTVAHRALRPPHINDIIPVHRNTTRIHPDPIPRTPKTSRLLNTLNAVLHLLVELTQPVEVLLRRLPVATTIRLKERRHHRAERVRVEVQ